MLTVEHDNRLVDATPFLQWANPTGAAAGTRHVHKAQISGVLLAAEHWDLETAASVAALRRANLAEQGVRVAALNQISSDLERHGILDEPSAGKVELLQRITECTEYDRKAQLLDDADVEDLQPYDGGNPCPDELQYLKRTSFYALLQRGAELDEDCPGALLSLALHVLGSRNRRATRDDDGSAFWAAAEMLRQQVIGWAHLSSDASPGAVAGQLPDFLATLSQSIPTELVVSTCTQRQHLADLRDGLVLTLGREAEVAAVQWRRLHTSMGNHFATLSALGPVLTSVANTRGQMELLIQGFIPEARGQPLTLVKDLERVLSASEKRGHIAQMVNDGMGLLDIVEALRNERDVMARSSSAGGGPVAAAEAGDTAGEPVAGGPLSNDNVARAISSATFRNTVATCTDGTADPDGGEATPLTGIELLDEVAHSGNMLLLRYMLYQEKWLKPKHPFFDMLHSKLVDRLAYFSRALVLSEDDTVQLSLADYTWVETQLQLFIKGMFHQMDRVNAKDGNGLHLGGYYAIQAMENGAQYRPVDPAEIYLVEATLSADKYMLERLTLAIGYPSEPTSGYSIDECYNAQIAVVRNAMAQPPQERIEWLKWADGLFRTHILQRAGALMVSTLTASNVAEQAFDGFVDADTPYFTRIKERKQVTEPIVLLRKAFPHIMPSEPVAVPGTSASFSEQTPYTELPGHMGAGGSSAPDPDGGDDGVRKPGKGKGKDRDKPGAGSKEDKPGSKSHLAKPLDGGNKLFLAFKTYDIAGLAKFYQVKLEDKCWPVLLSSKPGAAALALCPDCKTHGPITSKWHVPPKGFKLKTAVDKFAEKSTPAELKEAGFQVNKKAKV